MEPKVDVYFNDSDLKAATEVDQVLRNLGLKAAEKPEQVRKNNEQAAMGIAGKRAGSDDEKLEYITGIVDIINNSDNPEAQKQQAIKSVKNSLGSALGVKAPAKLS